MRTIFVMTVLTALAACGSPSAPANETAAPMPDATPTAEATLNQLPIPKPAADKHETIEKTDALDFRYVYPAAAGAYAGLSASLDHDRDEIRRDALKAATDDQKDAAGSDRPFNQHASTTEWKVVTQTAQYLSLSAKLYEFSGGAHGNTGFDSLVWDKTGDKRLDPAKMVDPAALQKAAGPAFCRAIDAQRAKKRGAPVEAKADDPFSACPAVSDGTLILGSTDGKAFDRVGFLIGPYVAGPYAEGTYEVTLPVTAAIRAAVKPDYRDAFAAR